MMLFHNKNFRAEVTAHCQTVPIDVSGSSP